VARLITAARSNSAMVIPRFSARASISLVFIGWMVARGGSTRDPKPAKNVKTPP
jgi:hypothetical protein